MAVVRLFNDIPEYLALIMPNLMIDEAGFCLYIGIARSMKFTMYSGTLEAPLMLAVFDREIYQFCAFMNLKNALVLPPIARNLENNNYHACLAYLADYLNQAGVSLER